MSSLHLEDAADPMAAAVAAAGDAQFDAASLLAPDETATTHLGVPSRTEDAALRNGVLLGAGAATAVALFSVLCLTDASTLHGWTERLAHLPMSA